MCVCVCVCVYFEGTTIDNGELFEAIAGNLISVDFFSITFIR